MLTAQMTAKKRLKLFGQAGADAVTSELEQLLYQEVMEVVDGNKLTREQKKAAL